MHQSIGSLHPKLSREPRTLQHPRLRPVRRSETTLCRQMLSQGSQQSIPALVANGRWLVCQQRRLRIGCLPPVLLHELPDEFPPRPVIGRPRQAPGEIRDGHGLVAHISQDSAWAVSNPAWRVRTPILAANGRPVRTCQCRSSDSAAQQSSQLPQRQTAHDRPAFRGREEAKKAGLWVTRAALPACPCTCARSSAMRMSSDVRRDGLGLAAARPETDKPEQPGCRDPDAGGDDGSRARRGVDQRGGGEDAKSRCPGDSDALKRLDVGKALGRGHLRDVGVHADVGQRRADARPHGGERSQRERGRGGQDE